MNIGIVTVALSHGGAERVGVTLANGFCQRGHEVMILTDLHEPVDYIPDERIKLVGFLKKREHKFLRWFKAIGIIRKTVKKEKPDVMIGIMGLCTLVTYIACMGLHVPVVMTEHNSFERPESAPMPLYLKFFKFYINKLYQTITVLTEADKKVIGNRLSNVTVMPNPLALIPVKTIPPKEKILLAAGRVDAWHYKGFDVLIKAWARLLENDKLKIETEGWRLKIAGVCHHEENYREIPNLIEKLGVSNSVSLLGLCTDMEALYRRSEIFVLSSRYEGFGLVLIEAMSQGCACVACDFRGRQREIILDDSMGLCCAPDDVEALAMAMERMITDETYRHTVQQNGIERSKYYSLDNTIERWEDYLKGIAKK